MDLDRLVADAEICVRCGLCTSVCPLVPETEKALVLEAAYDCLDCRACQSVCPNGVRPGEAALDARVALQGGKPKDALTRQAEGRPHRARASLLPLPAAH